MSTAMLVPLGTGNRTLTIGLFLAVVAVTLGITFWASRQTKTATDFYAGGRSFSGFQNGLAIGGDYMSAASFLGISGAIALYGYDGFLYSIGFLVAWLVALLLVAELLRNSGRYTMADVLAFRMRQRRCAPRRRSRPSSCRSSTCWPRWSAPARWWVCCSASPARLLKNLVIVAVGVLMIVYVTVGGMKGTTWVQIVKAVLLMVGAILITFLVLASSASTCPTCSARPPRSPARARRSCSPDCGTVRTWSARSTSCRLALALVLGTAGLPHILIRFYTMPTARRHASRCSGRSA